MVQKSHKSQQHWSVLTFTNTKQWLKNAALACALKTLRDKFWSYCSWKNVLATHYIHYILHYTLHTYIYPEQYSLSY